MNKKIINFKAGKVELGRIRNRAKQILKELGENYKKWRQWTEISK